MGIRLFERRNGETSQPASAEKVVEFPHGYKESVRWVPRIGDIFPNFSAPTTHGRINFHEFAEGSWTLLFSHPSIRSAVSATEFASLAANQGDFDARGVKLLGIACESVKDHARWESEIGRLFATQIMFPVVDDSDARLSSAFGAIHPKQGADFAIRKTFIIDPCMRVKMIFEYPVNVGRSVEETLRAIDALQVTEAHRLGMPADWEPGQACTVAPYINDEQAELAHGKVRRISPTIRLVDCPTAPPNIHIPAPPPQTISETYRR